MTCGLNSVGFPYHPPHADSEDHANNLKSAQSLHPCFQFNVRHPCIEEEIDDYDIVEYDFSIDVGHAFSRDLIPSYKVTSLHIHVYAMVGLRLESGSGWDEFWMHLHSLQELVCYGSAAQPISMFAVLKSLSNSPTGEIVSDSDQDDDINEQAWLSGEGSAGDMGNTTLKRLRFIGDCVLYGEELIHRAALLVRCRGKWEKRWEFLELTFLVDGEDGLPLDVTYWENVYRKDLGRMNRVADTFRYTFRVQAA